MFANNSLATLTRPKNGNAVLVPPPMEQPRLEIREADGKTLATIQAQEVFREEDVVSLKDRLSALVRNRPQPQLQLDLGPVRDISSHMVAVLISLRRQVQAAGGQFSLCGLNPDLVCLFERLKLSKLFAI